MQSVLGFVVAMTGVLWYTKLRMDESSARPAPAAPSAAAPAEVAEPPPYAPPETGDLERVRRGLSRTTACWLGRTCSHRTGTMATEGGEGRARASTDRETPRINSDVPFTYVPHWRVVLVLSFNTRFGRVCFSPRFHTLYLRPHFGRGQFGGERFQVVGEVKLPLVVELGAKPGSSGRCAMVRLHVRDCAPPAPPTHTHAHTCTVRTAVVLTSR